MTRPPLACTVRACALPLERHARTCVCPAGHSYDIARSGYLNLLQPQDRRASVAGDSPDAVAARERLLSAGIGRSIQEDIARLAARLDLGGEPVVVELGCGSGDLLGDLARRRSIVGVGIDLSPTAIQHAARRPADLTWIVSNADRRVPLRDHSVRLALSVHGRRNPRECLRILSHDGLLLVAVPAPDDLAELRTFIEGRGVARDRSAAVEMEHAAGFDLVERSTFRERHHLERSALLDLLRATYRGERRSVAPRVDALVTLEVTLASDVLLFAPRA